MADPNEEESDDGKPLTAHADKRCLVLESEFASVLKMTERHGNILSTIIRNLWDQGTTEILTKKDPVRTKDAHLSIIGHITQGELIRYLTDTEVGNGFANRFLFACVKRSNRLPEGGNLDWDALEPIIKELSDVFAEAVQVKRIRFDSEARDLWHAVYSSISKERPGLLGSVISRAEAHAMRIASIYALLDGEKNMRRRHLEAALSICRYCEESAAYIFGDSLGDAVADKILGALRLSPEGMNRTEISGLFGRNKKASEIERALRLLEAIELGRMEKVPVPGATRPIEVWHAV